MIKQCKDIPDDMFLSAVRVTVPMAGTWRDRDAVQMALEAVIGPVPENLLLAKARKLEASGKLGGCTCGCRGDWHPADECDDSMCCRKDTK